MSLEQAMHENTSAIKELIAALKSQAGQLVQATTPGKQPKGSSAAEAETNKPSKPAPKSSGSATGAMSYDKDVKPYALRLAELGGRDALVKLNEEFSIGHAKELAEDQWAKYVKRAKALIEAAEKAAAAAEDEGEV